MVAFTSRHGSRYPDPGSYSVWMALQSKIQGAPPFQVHEPLSFISTWKPVLRNPDLEMSQISLGGYKELYDMGYTYRTRYPQLYSENQTFVAWANMYQEHQPRVIDSARLFVRGYLGPNATTLGSIYVLNNTDPRAVANSLAPSDLCPMYRDTSGGINATTWNNIYLPAFAARLNALITPPGALNFTISDVSQFPVLCGFESQITGTTSPFCALFTEDELRGFEYAQDIRYYYGSGPGAVKNNTFMLPFLSAVISRFVDGPGKEYMSKSLAPYRLPPLIATFTNDGQINQLVSSIGVFDNEPSLPPTYIPNDQKYIASHFVTMRGTITFERLTCDGADGPYVRILLNDAIYPVVGCDSGPGRSCPLAQYQEIVANKQNKSGNFVHNCFGPQSCAVVQMLAAEGLQAKTTFLTDLDLPWEYVVQP
ncbi:histidine acid phosphatase [Trichoderma evansii]